MNIARDHHSRRTARKPSLLTRYDRLVLLVRNWFCIAEARCNKRQYRRRQKNHQIVFEDAAVFDIAYHEQLKIAGKKIYESEKQRNYCVKPPWIGFLGVSGNSRLKSIRTD
ncbi:hypothetical protein SDC9_178764 [bioreactor metagenome]|uniref:Uncharacterized protein n=1 Tax=bioreactor metagenome TaxID=1076179 RepID=A0A645GY21_9ZZZZ